MSATPRARQHYFTLVKNPGPNCESVEINHSCGKKCTVQTDDKGHYRFYCAWCEKYVKLSDKQVKELL